MSCGAGIRRPGRTAREQRAQLKSVGTKQRFAGTQAEENDLEIAGTWDFKWPLGTKIRVAFQRVAPQFEITDSAFASARKRVIKGAQHWQLPPGIQLEFLGPDQDLEPPLGPENSLTDQHRSPFLSDAPIKNPYDVLVSLQPLPAVRIDPFRPFGDEVEHVIFPLSELGSYSRRADFGSPTVFLGPFGKTWPTDEHGFDPSAAFTRYFDSPLGQHVVVHEFGHVLGLPHSHQYPLLVLPGPGGAFSLEQINGARKHFYRDTLDLKVLMEKLFGVDVTDKIVTAHLLAAWKGNLKFSDWHSLTPAQLAEHQVTGRLDSVMRLPFYPCTIRAHAPCNICGKGTYEANDLFTTPQAHDVNTLQLMYDPSYVDAGPVVTKSVPTAQLAADEATVR